MITKAQGRPSPSRGAKASSWRQVAQRVRTQGNTSTPVQNGNAKFDVYPVAIGAQSGDQHNTAGAMVLHGRHLAFIQAEQEIPADTPSVVLVAGSDISPRSLLALLSTGAQGSIEGARIFTQNSQGHVTSSNPLWVEGAQAYTELLAIQLSELGVDLADTTAVLATIAELAEQAYLNETTFSMEQLLQEFGLEVKNHGHKTFRLGREVSINHHGVVLKTSMIGVSSAHNLIRAELTEDFSYRDLTFAKGTTVSFHPSGAVKKGILKEDAVIKGVPVKAGHEFILSKSGEVESCVLAADHVVTIPLLTHPLTTVQKAAKAGTIIIFDHSTRSKGKSFDGTLVEDFEFGGFTFKGGKRLRVKVVAGTGKDGIYVKGKATEGNTFEGFPIEEGTEISVKYRFNRRTNQIELLTIGPLLLDRTAKLHGASLPRGTSVQYNAGLGEYTIRPSDDVDIPIEEGCETMFQARGGRMLRLYNGRLRRQ